ncbi:Fic family protein [Budviciaceae bacterium CWB-B4]|uniref:Fic family protein n=1 Tax=Limnobaculum xujianqingii TaxID=2738837 RepID=A0A9D7AG60_9GAMM|nr:Fic family protein [Limnobaculum xujianqingii]MBK5072123.1 Fic family protein [Limnobaculum xujianqingii]MBK5175432.1 Fic family protein [Limnobaculum xujianqingii]
MMGHKYSPLYTITPSVLNSVAEISELLGYWSAKDKLVSPQLRRENRIRTIQASLAIEHNSLSTEQVTAIMDGKQVLGPAKDIQEVRNAILAYERLPYWHSGQIEHFLEAHKLLMQGLVDYPGQWRNGNVGIYRGKQLIHMAPLASQIPRLMTSLFDWLASADIHSLIKSCIFHYELEFIHPFSDGNGRMGRLWQTVILSEWRPELAWLPVETLIQKQQNDYYHVLGEADKASDCTCFIDFMLRVIAEALKEGIDSHSDKMSGEMTVEMSGENESIALHKVARQIFNVLKQNPTMTIPMVAEKLQVSTRTVERHLNTLQQLKLLERVGSTKAGYWKVV